MSLRCRNITEEVTNQETRRIAKNNNNKKRITDNELEKFRINFSFQQEYTVTSSR